MSVADANVASPLVPPKGQPGLICVSMQIFEAGVDISAHRRWNEIAPCILMLQYVGRLNREGTSPRESQHDL